MNKLVYFFIIILAIVVLVCYYKLFFTFYQQDEWGTLGYVMTEGLKGFLSGHSFASLITGGGRPLAIPVQFVFYKFFPFQVFPFVLYAIFSHFVNSVMLFILMQKISRNAFIAVVTALFFATASAGQQPIS